MYVWLSKKKQYLFPVLTETIESDVQAVLIDCSSVIFVDIAGARLFTQVRDLDFFLIAKIANIAKQYHRVYYLNG